MCGIVGYIGRRNCVPIVLEGLRRLEYRGYDSAGIALIRGGDLFIQKNAGKVADLAARLGGANGNLHATVGMGHTRWATDKENWLFLGRGFNYPVALEGALKLKEISYIHAEAYPAGELKHGPLALVDEDMPVIAVAPNNDLLEKLKSNLREVRARGGELYVFADADSEIAESEGVHIIRMPEHYGLLSPVLHVVPLQLLAYHIAVRRGCDVDQPRNLAKSVTVE